MNSSSPDALVPSRRANQWFIVWTATALVLPHVGLFALHFLHFRRCWVMPHLQFFPLSMGLAVWLLATSHRGFFFPESPAHRIKFVLGVAINLVGILVGCYSLYLVSPFVSQIGSLGITLGWALVALSKTNWTRVVAICSLLAVTIPLPGNRDRDLIAWLQSFSSAGCAAILDALHIPNIREGNVIQITSRRLFVEEACSGVDSLYALTAVTLALLILNRGSFVVALITLLTVPVWAMIGNLLRLGVIALAEEYMHWDLATGWIHTALGLVLFALISLCLFATAIAIQSLAMPVPPNAQTPNPVSRIYSAMVAWPQLIPQEGKASENSNEDNDKNLAPLVQTSRGFPYWMIGTTWVPTMALLALGGLAGWVQWQQPSIEFVGYSLDQATADRFPGDSFLPPTIGTLRKLGYQPETRSTMSAFGAYSHTWLYQDSQNQATISIDFPFPGWHGLYVCYTNTGWSILDKKQTTMSEPDGENWSIEDFALQNKFGEFGHVWYANFNGKGGRERLDSLTEARDRLNLFVRLSALNQGNKIANSEMQTCYQVQLFVESGIPLTEEQKQNYRQLFLQTFEKLRIESLPLLKEIGS